MLLYTELIEQTQSGRAQLHAFARNAIKGRKNHRLDVEERVHDIVDRVTLGCPV